METLGDFVTMFQSMSKAVFNDDFPGWVDYFCGERELYKRTKDMIFYIDSVLVSAPDLRDCELTFRNCCPFLGDTYDVFSLNSNEFALTVVPSDGHHGCDNGNSIIYDHNQPRGKEEVVNGFWADALDYFKKLSKMA